METVYELQQPRRVFLGHGEEIPKGTLVKRDGSSENNISLYTVVTPGDYQGLQLDIPPKLEAALLKEVSGA